MNRTSGLLDVGFNVFKFVAIPAEPPFVVPFVNVAVLVQSLPKLLDALFVRGTAEDGKAV